MIQGLCRSLSSVGGVASRGSGVWRSGDHEGELFGEIWGIWIIRLYIENSYLIYYESLILEYLSQIYQKSWQANLLTDPKL